MIRSRVELPVGEGALAQGEGHRFGGAPGLRLEEFVQAERAGVFGGGLVPIVEELAQFLLAEQRLDVMWLVESLQHQLVGARVEVRQALDHPAVEDTLVGEQGHGQVVPVESAGDIDVEVEVRLPEAGRAEHFQPPPLTPRHVVVGVEVRVVEQHLVE